MPKSGSRQAAPELHWQSVAEGVYSVGFDGDGFAFDNEGPRHNVYLTPFRLASRLVTNGEYMEFMRDERLRHRHTVAVGWMGLRARQSVERSAVLGDA